ncbi:TetR/AcrR family transcriptional regulator [Maribacter algarum]|uniref:TetR/AcrR family transcriptional regulator n=1 Tax=Maribacter algarum (ex Zhang et al. 2020) TaxID=2578118 RepID=A0A5S3PTI5_9FLAO|nr:TetR family transcriptional regulator C-terminal domain-containing protein [Maribacter algarum]TMM56000.1 TetR/AcrR family transcriptional regulator [Maribacter algarum]
MATKTKTKKITDDMIISMYMDYVLEHEVVPKSVYKFCKINDIDEAVFYENFGSVEGIQKSIWSKFYTNTKSLIEKNKEYDSFSNKDKMLTFFYSFFELLTLNRSYVLFALPSDRTVLKNMEQLKELRRHVKAFSAELIEDGNSTKSLKITKHNPRLFSEGAWLQFLFILKFWMDDGSAGFEKTDVAIEKSINTIFDVFDNTPLDNIIDFGKFLFKEKFV